MRRSLALGEQRSQCRQDDASVCFSLHRTKPYLSLPFDQRTLVKKVGPLCMHEEGRFSGSRASKVIVGFKLPCSSQVPYCSTSRISRWGCVMCVILSATDVHNNVLEGAMAAAESQAIAPCIGGGTQAQASSFRAAEG